MIDPIHQEYLDRFEAQETHEMTRRLLQDEDRLDNPETVKTIMRASGKQIKVERDGSGKITGLSPQEDYTTNFPTAEKFWTELPGLLLNAPLHALKAGDDTLRLMHEFAGKAGEMFGKKVASVVKPGSEQKPTNPTKPQVVGPLGTVAGSLGRAADTLGMDAAKLGLTPETPSNLLGAFEEKTTPETLPGEVVKSFADFGATLFFIPGGSLSKLVMNNPGLRLKAITMFKEMGRLGMVDFLQTGNGNHAERDIRDSLVKLAASDPQVRQAFREVLTAEDKHVDTLVQKFTAAGVGAATLGVPLVAKMLPRAMKLLRQKVGRISVETADALMDAGTGTYLGKDGSLYRYAKD
jgi:hypothetical protein